MGIIMIKLAVDSPDTLVGKDWYKDGLAINQKLDKQNRAKALGLKADITLDQKIGAIYVWVTGLDPNQSPQLTLQLTHPTLSTLDQQLDLHVTPQSRYYAKLTSLPKGFYYVNLSAPGQDWAIDSTVNFSNRLFRSSLTPTQ